MNPLRHLNAATTFQLTLCCTWASAVLAGSLHDRRQSGTYGNSGTGYSFGKPGVNASFDYVGSYFLSPLYLCSSHWEHRNIVSGLLSTCPCSPLKHCADLENATVVGGGTGGLALATRLAEDPSISVAVVEAGGFYEADDGNISQVPAYDIFYAGTGANTTNPLVDWGFLTTPQAVCLFCRC